MLFILRSYNPIGKVLVLLLPKSSKAEEENGVGQDHLASQSVVELGFLMRSLTPRIVLCPLFSTSSDLGE